MVDVDIVKNKRFNECQSQLWLVVLFLGRVSEVCKMVVILGFDLVIVFYKLQELVFLIIIDICFGYFVIFKFNVY